MIWTDAAIDAAQRAREAREESAWEAFRRGWEREQDLRLYREACALGPMEQLDGAQDVGLMSAIEAYRYILGRLGATT